MNSLRMLKLTTVARVARQAVNMRAMSALVPVASLGTRPARRVSKIHYSFLNQIAEQKIDFCAVELLRSMYRPLQQIEVERTLPLRSPITCRRPISSFCSTDSSTCTPDSITRFRAHGNSSSLIVHRQMNALRLRCVSFTGLPLRRFAP